MQNSIKNSERGFTLVELLIAMAISLVVLTSLSSAFISQRKTYAVQEQITEMIQGPRGAMDIISRDVRMAGLAPTGYDIKFESDPTASQTSPKMQRTNPAATRFVGIPYSATQLEIRADLNGDGDTLDTNETIIYKENNGTITRQDGTNTAVTLVENLVGFGFIYWKDGATPTAPTQVMAAGEEGEIRQIDITITTQTSKKDPNYGQNNGYRKYTLSSYVTPPNLDF